MASLDYAATKAGTHLGRPCGLTSDVSKAIVQALRLGATVAIACGAAGFGESVYYQWKAQGRRDIEAGEKSIFADFADAVSKASRGGDVELLASVRRQTRGLTCKGCDGLGTIKVGRRSQRCDGCRGSGFAINPDGRLALDLLGRRHPDDYGRKSRQRVEIVGDGGGPVRVDVRATALAVNLNTLTVEQLAALATGGGGVIAAIDAIPLPPALGARREPEVAGGLGAGLAAAVVEAVVEADDEG